MRAMVLHRVGEPLKLEADWPDPEPSEGEVLLRVRACGICRTDLHIVDGDLTKPKLPLVMGHQIVGEVVSKSERFEEGQRVGVPWLGGCCEHCWYCKEGRENLCDSPTFTGYQKDGGYADYVVAREDFCFPLDPELTDFSVAPLLCAGMVGYRSYKMTGDAKRIGFYGFGSAAHILTQLARYEGKEVYAYTRPGDKARQEFACELGAVWAGGSDEVKHGSLDAAIIFAPIGPLVVNALRSVRKGGVVVCAGIHMSDIPSMPYELLWGERVLRSVANLTREDGTEFLDLASKAKIKTTVEAFKLEDANQALERLRGGIEGSAVLYVSG